MGSECLGRPQTAGHHLREMDAAEWYAETADRKSIDLKVRGLSVDTRLEEYTTAYAPASDHAPDFGVSCAEGATAAPRRSNPTKMSS
jgi:hypothetical protein